METTTVVLTMLLAVAVSTSLARLTGWPLPFVQIALGVVIAVMPLPSVELQPEIFFLVLLPPLLFLDGWRIPKRDLLRDRRSVVAMAVGLVIFTVLGMGFFIHWLVPQMPLSVAFALAAVLAPTDPVAVSSIASRVPIPSRLMHILEGEALFNDASGLICLRFATAAAVTGAFSLPQAAAAFVWLAFGGIAVGVVGSFLVARAQRYVMRHVGEDAGTMTLVSILIPFGVYLLAEAIGASGILAAAAAGVTISFVESEGGAQALTRMRRMAVWQTIDLAANGAIFVILGEQLPSIAGDALTAAGDGQSGILVLLGYVVALNVALLLVRFVWVLSTVHFIYFRSQRRRIETPKVSMLLVVATTLAGVKGTITLAGILTLPTVLGDGSPFPARDLAIVLAMSVILSTLSFATFLLPPLLSRLHLEPSVNDEEHTALTQSGAAARAAIEKRRDALVLDGRDAGLVSEAAGRAFHRYDDRDALLDTNEARLVHDREVLALVRDLQLSGLEAERRVLFRLQRARTVDEGIIRRLVRQVDLLETRLRDD